MARRRIHTINTQTWEPALSAINKMERAMVNVMVKLGGVTPSDVIDWLVPAEQLALLRAATPHAELNSSSFSSDQMRSIQFPFAKVTFYLDFVHMGCIPPKKGLIAPQPSAPKAAELRAAMATISGIVTQHNKLRSILRWFTQHEVTAGAARHYFPTLQSLLPTDHRFFEVKGGRFKDAHIPYDIAECLREAPEIIAKGLLVDPNRNGKDKEGRSLVRVNVDGSHVFVLMSKGETA
jgi:hypothetical protein